MSASRFVKDPKCEFFVKGRQGSEFVRTWRGLRSRKDEGAAAETELTLCGIDVRLDNASDDFEYKAIRELTSLHSREDERSEAAALPVASRREEIVSLVREHPVVVVVGETGSGKTTQIPQYLLDDLQAEFPSLTVTVTQPRRVAATSVARRVASERGCTLGTGVGYKVRFDDKTGQDTRIRYVTDGILLREMAQRDVSLHSQIICVDEAHERSVSSDVLLGLLFAATRRCLTFRLVVMSATLDAALFSRYFHGAPVVNVSGRTHPVAIVYSSAVPDDYVMAAVEKTVDVHVAAGSQAGDVLVFLTGRDEVEACLWGINLRLTHPNPEWPSLLRPLLIPLYSSLPPESQNAAFVPTPPGCRKIIVATNVAETSLTVPGVRHIIDCGYAKMTDHSAQIGLHSLLVTPIAVSQAQQRAGRAGRTAPGTAHRLYPEDVLEDQMIAFPVPEILRSDLTTVALLIRSHDTDPNRFDFITSPPAHSLAAADRLLSALGAVSDGKLTPLGAAMAELPLTPMSARSLLAASACEYLAPGSGVLRDMAAVAAILAGGDPFLRGMRSDDPAMLQARVRFQHSGSDHCALASLLGEYMAQPLRKRAEWCVKAHVNSRMLAQAVDVQKQLIDTAKPIFLRSALPFTWREDLPECIRSISRDELLIRCVIAGSPISIAQSNGIQAGHVDTVTGVAAAIPFYSAASDTAALAAVSGASGRIVVVYSTLQLGESNQPTLQNVSAVKAEWVAEAHSDIYGLRQISGGTVLETDYAKVRETLVGDLRSALPAGVARAAPQRTDTSQRKAKRIRI